MANGINEIILLGNLGSQPELRHLPNGNPVLNISLCTDESYYNDQNEKVLDEEWHNLQVFGRKAETLAKHANKGDQIFIKGRNKTRKWDKDGQTHYTTEVQVKDFRFLRNGTRGDQAPAAQQAPYNQSPQPAAQPTGFYEADGSAMPSHLVKQFRAAGYTEGWLKGQLPPVLPNQ